MSTKSQLDSLFAIPGRVAIAEGPGGFAQVVVTTPEAEAVISTYAGQVLSFRPRGQDDLMFLSDTAFYAPGKAIKGGVPVCWPWFGPDPEGKGRPGHGFVRNRQWELRLTEVTADGPVRVCLGLVDSEETRGIWPHAFDLELEVLVGTELELGLTTRNRGDAPFVLGQALHTYFKVGDIGRTEVMGLGGCRYLDKMDGGAEKRQQGPVTVDAETDRVYLGVGDRLEIVDQSLGRRIAIATSGSTSAVVWNPWAATAKAMADLGDDDYKVMLCVETCNAEADTVTLAPGAVHRLGATYSLAAP
ncbi:MAG: D-hexose-6-phosphate mutarotase [Actinomycetota bacterium]